MTQDLQKIVSNLPVSAGVYRFYDTKGILLYVGKAKNLKNRVGSYFTNKHQNLKTLVLVKKIAQIECVVVENEYEALLLENSFIKKFQPKYNINLKDDKTYPWIGITQERFPKLIVTRNPNKVKAQYYGPYAMAKSMNVLLNIIKDTLPLRTCTLNLSQSAIDKQKYTPCLEYHIGKCMAPCMGWQSEADYLQNIEHAKSLLKGAFKPLWHGLKAQMQSHAQSLEFEKAQRVKEQIEQLKQYQFKSTVVNPLITDTAVFGLIIDQDHAYVNSLIVAHGVMVNAHTIEMQIQLDETAEDLLAQGILVLIDKLQITQKHWILPFEIPALASQAKISVPQSGDKKGLLELSEKNAQFYRIDKLKNARIVDPERHAKRLMAETKSLLHLPAEPWYIEGFDNSNIQGAHAVSACVVFRGGKPSKSDYRIFNVKTVEGPDDFATMREVIYRRYHRLIEEQAPLPNLIVIDGGKGQLSAAVDALKQLGLYGKISIIGIAKRLEEIYFPNDPIPLYLDKKSETLRMIQHIRNEAHRFGISKHRAKRQNDMLSKSMLEGVKGIGPKTKEALWIHYKTLERIKSASIEELIILIGKQKAQLIFDFPWDS